MSNDNFAIEIEPEEGEEDGEDDGVYLNDGDVEAGLATSRSALIHNFEVERPTSLVASIKESARSSSRKAKYYCSFITTPIQKILSTFKLLIIIAIYSFLGAHLFMHLEVPNDLADKEDAYHKRKIAREIMVLNLRAIHYDNREDREERWKQAIISFEQGLSLDEPVIETAWTFWMSFLYAGTIFTTIGYGNIACKTRAGQIATMIYAFAGIPIMLVMLTALNNALLKWIKIITNNICDLILYTGVRLGVTVIHQSESKKRWRYTNFAKKMKNWGLTKNSTSTTIAVSISEEDRLNSNFGEGEEEEEMEQDPPVFSTLFATVAWIMLSAGVFCLFEDWTFFTSFYFCFISLTTIGLGDVTPANPQYMIATFGVVLIGLSMLTVCIDVIKEKLAQMYMALLQKLLRDYMEAVKNGDPNAASAMMARFQGNAKFLMPLISKNEGAKVMNKFKSDCTKKGIDPPHVLTDINPETGMPAFANASKEDFNDYIDVAEERFAEEQQKLAQTPIPKSPNFESAAFQRSSQLFAESATVPRQQSLEVQVGVALGKLVELGSQAVVESSDEGIQTDYSSDMDDKECQTPYYAEKMENILPPKPVTSEVATQYEFVGKSTIGIQPEVSSIFLQADADDDSDDDYDYSIRGDESGDTSDSSTDSEEDSDDDGKELLSDAATLAQGLQSPPIEITASLSDHELSETTLKPEDSKKLIPARVEKSASMDSAETVIHLTPEDIKQNKKMARRKKLKTRKRRKPKEGHELRFLKNCGNQVAPILLDCATQYEVFYTTRETSSQYSTPTHLVPRNRKCQTKLSSINQEQLRGIQETLRRRESQLTTTSEASTSQSNTPHISRRARIQPTSSKSPTDNDNDYVDKDADGKRRSSESDVAEVSLDLSLVAFGVDEFGRVVDVPSDMEKVKETIRAQRANRSRRIVSDSESEYFPESDASPPVDHPKKSIGVLGPQIHFDVDDLDDEDLESLGELELFTMDAFAQTEEKRQVDKNVTVDVINLGIMKNESSQTTIETIVKKYQEPTTSVETLESGMQTEPSEVEKPTTSEYSSQTEIEPEAEAGKDEESQTGPMEEPRKPEASEADSQTEIQIFESSGIQTDERQIEIASCSSQTFEDLVPRVVIVQVEMEIQTDSGQFSESHAFQTDEIPQPPKVSSENRDIEMQTDVASTSESHIQTEAASTSESGLQTESLSTTESDIQTEVVSTSESDVQTEYPSCSEEEVQTDSSPPLLEYGMQTEWAKLHASETQTELGSCSEDLETQTDLEVVARESESQTEDSTSLSMSCQTSKEELGGYEDMEAQTSFPTFNAESQTSPQMSSEDQTVQTELPTFDRETQFGANEFYDKTVEAIPQSATTSTEPDAMIHENKSCQTELVMKNKRSQEDLSEVREPSSPSHTLSSSPDSEKVEKVELAPSFSLDFLDTSAHPQLKEIPQNKPAALDIARNFADQGIQIEIDRKSINLSPIAIDVSHSFTMTEFEDGQEKGVQVEERIFEEISKGSDSESWDLNLASSSLTVQGPLWSDFDYVPDLDEFGREKEWLDGETQTPLNLITYSNGKEVASAEEESSVEVPKSPSLKIAGSSSQASHSDAVASDETDESRRRSDQIDVHVFPEIDSEDDTTNPERQDLQRSHEASSSSSKDGEEAEVEVGVQVAPPSADANCQTVKFKKRSKQQAEKNVEARIEMSTSTVQATTEMCEQSVGEGDKEEDWLQVYVQELDEERRLRMSDIGIQTGVLARVQHIYTRPISDDVSATSSAPITLRKSSDSSEQLSVKMAKSSDESLTPLSAAESLDDRIWTERSSPFGSRQSSTKKRSQQMKDVERKIDRSNLVQDLRARFEKSPTPPIPPKSPEPPSK